MINLTEQVKMISPTDWNHRREHEIVEIEKTAVGTSPKVFKVGDRLPLIKNHRRGYTVNLNPVAVPFEAVIISAEGIPYQVTATFTIRCVDSAKVALEFHNGLDPVSERLHQIRVQFQNRVEMEGEFDVSTWESILSKLLYDGAIPVEDVDEICVLDNSTQFQFSLHTDDVTLDPVHPESNVSPVPSDPSPIIIKLPSRSPENSTSRIKVLSASTTGEPTEINRVRVTSTKPSEALSVYAPAGLELVNTHAEAYTIEAEVHGRTGKGTNENIKNLRISVLDHLEISAQTYSGEIDEFWIKSTIAAMPYLVDFQAVIDSVEITRFEPPIYHSIDLQFGSTDEPLQFDIGDGRFIEIEAKVGYQTHHRNAINETEVMTYITDQLRMAASEATVDSKENFRAFIATLQLEDDFGLKFREIVHLRFEEGIQSKTIALEEKVGSRDGYFAVVKATITCRVVSKARVDEAALKLHLITELKKAIRATDGRPEAMFCEQVIEQAGKTEIGRFVVDGVFVEVEDITKRIRVELGNGLKLKTAEGYAFTLLKLSVFCRGFRNDDETRAQILAYLESALVENVTKSPGDPDDIIIGIPEILRNVGYIEPLEVTVDTVGLPEVETDFLQSYSIQLSHLKLQLKNGKSYIVEGEIHGDILDRDAFREKGKEAFVAKMANELQTQAWMTTLDALTAEVCKQWIADFPRFKKESFKFDDATLQVRHSDEESE
jgi:hypothetical protein